MPLKLALVRLHLSRLMFRPVFDQPLPERFDMRKMEKTFFWVDRPPVKMTLAYDEDGVLWIHAVDTIDLTPLGFKRHTKGSRNV